MLDEWHPNPNTQHSQRFYVLRDKLKLHEIEQFLNAKRNTVPKNVDENCLIPVTLTLNDRGNPGQFSIICLQNRSDVKRARGLSRGKKWSLSLAKEPALTQQIAADKNECKRKQLRLNHLQLLKRLRRKRVRVKRKQQEYSERKVIIAPPQTAKFVTEQYEQMCELWLPATPKTIRQQCMREVFGYLTQCQFMFHEAKVCGTGYVTINGLRKLSQCNGRALNQVLVRDPNSLNYHLARISIRFH